MRPCCELRSIYGQHLGLAPPREGQSRRIFSARCTWVPGGPALVRPVLPTQVNAKFIHLLNGKPQNFGPVGRDRETETERERWSCFKDSDE